MARVLRRLALLFLVLFPLVGCGGSTEKQWYKAGGSYTVAEFERDQRACTTNRVLDEQCLRDRGWIGLSPDRQEPVPPPQPRKRY
jgi:hypothetical protein